MLCCVVLVGPLRDKGPQTFEMAQQAKMLATVSDSSPNTVMCMRTVISSTALRGYHCKETWKAARKRQWF